MSIVKNGNSNVKLYEYAESFTGHYSKAVSGGGGLKPSPQQTENQKAMSEAEIIIKKAEERAAEILHEAKINSEELRTSVLENVRHESMQLAVEIKEKAYGEGFALGEAEAARQMEMIFRENMDEAVQMICAEIMNIENERAKIVKNHISEIKDLAISVAEKVVKTSLRGSEDIIVKMILSEVEKLKTTQWVKIYIAEVDAEKVIKCEKSILRALNGVTTNVKFEIMENGESGTCILELPDQIIDAGAETLIRNVASLLEGM